MYDIHELYPSDLPEGWKLERPDDEFWYRNWPGYHAPTVLKKYYEELHSLRLFPIGPGLHHIEDSTDPDSMSAVAYIMSEVCKRYGWPSNFRAEAWARDYEDILEKAEDALEVERADEQLACREERDEVGSFDQESPGA